jgi:hypothetical protein
MTMTGRFPVRERAVAKICWRLGVRRAEIHALETRDSAIRLRSKCREFAIRGLLNWHRPAAIDQAGNETRAKSIVDVYYSHV